MPSRYPITDFNNLNVDWMIGQMFEQAADIDTLEAGVSANAGAIAQEVLDRQAADAGLQYQIDNITAGLTPVLDRTQNVTKKRHVLFVLDSFGAKPTTTTSPADKAAGYMGLASGDWEKIYQASIGFATTPSFYTLLTTTALTLTLAEVTDIVFIGGNNDLSSVSNETTVRTVMGDIWTWVGNNIPNAKVWVLFDAWRPATGQTPNDYMREQGIYQRSAAYCGFTYANITPSYHGTDLLSDGVHPTLAGSEALGYAIAQVLTGSPTPYGTRTWEKIQVTPSAVVTALENNWAFNCRIEDRLFLYISPGYTWTVNSGTPRQIAGDIWPMQQEYDAGTVDQALLNSPDLYPHMFMLPATFEYVESGGGKFDGMVMLRFYSGHIYVRFRGDCNHNQGSTIPPGSQGSEGYANISKVHFWGGTYEVSAFAN